jgi:hypothetical protein
MEWRHQSVAVSEENEEKRITKLMTKRRKRRRMTMLVDW